APSPFLDVGDSVHYEDVAYIANIGVTRGCNPPDNTLFCPTQSVTRAQMASFLVRALDLPPADRDYFVDDNGSIHEDDINALAAAASVHYEDVGYIANIGVTRACNPPDNSLFCPTQSVTRAQMASSLVRALDLPPADRDYFVDDNGSIHEDDINALAAAGVTRGCNPPKNDRFCPGQAVSRDQMAAFLVRGFGYTDPGEGNLFTDDNGSIFEGDIDRLATAGVTKGCNPPKNDRFCPTQPVTREQMASFLARAIRG